MQKIFLFLFLLAGLDSVKAQQAYRGNWDTYAVQSDKMLASVMVDLDFVQSPEAKEKANVVIVRIGLKQVLTDGMPAKAELDTLNALEEALVNTLYEGLNARYTGRYTQSGKRDFYFYTNDTSEYRRYIGSALQPFAAYQWVVLVKPDPEHSNYRTVLYPTPEEMEHIKNKRMTDALFEKGDELTAPRRVDHFLFFKSDAARRKFLDSIHEDGFQIESGGEELGGKDYPFSLQISRTDKVDYDSIDKVSIYLWKLAMKHFGRYDGWETFVVR